jgi:peptidyl-prolyl cis-trans isomerase C
MTLDRLKADTRNDLAVRKLMETQVASAEATDAEVQTFYENNPDKFKQGEQVRASHILKLVDDKADAATKAKLKAEMDAILKRAKSGEDFAALAREYSQDSSAQQGGDLGFFPRGQMVPAFDQAAFALKPGEISDVVTTQFGYHIIKVMEHKEPSTVSLDQVRPQVKNFLSGQKKQQQADQFIAELRQKSSIEVLI